VKLRRLLLCLLCRLLCGALDGLRLLAEDAGLRRLGRGLFLELLNAASSVDKLLLARVEWVAVRTQFNVDLFHGRTGCDDVAAGTDDLGVREIGRMDIRLHSAGTIAKTSFLGKTLHETKNPRKLGEENRRNIR